MQSEFRSSNVGTEWNYELRSEQEGENMQESSGQRKSIERETRGQSQHRGKPLRQTQRRTDAGVVDITLYSGGARCVCLL